MEVEVVVLFIQQMELLVLEEQVVAEQED